MKNEARPGKAVRLPHSAVELPLGYFDETLYQRRFAYQKILRWTESFVGREVFLLFDGAMADAVVWLNGKRIAAHRDGYTPFEAKLSGHLRQGANLLTVIIDGSENPEIPPFGGQIDYLTYAGLYRDVWLEVRDRVSIERIKIEPEAVLEPTKSLNVHCKIRNAAEASGGVLTAMLRDSEGREIATTTTTIQHEVETLRIEGLTDVVLWDVDRPILYHIEVMLECAAGSDRLASAFGFREAIFGAGGFRLNGRTLKIRGLNRHQAYPYVGYAMGRRAQERDAEILKYELRCNLVRTSHYPQSPWFLDHCDRIGLLVFEEIPGWQHIGGEHWRQASLETVRRMIQRDWNHPSIVLWGVRINESSDHHAFYSETNRLARALDPTRQTGGVRCIAESEFLEDVYTMNDFILGAEEMPGSNQARVPLRPRAEVTGLEHPVPYLVSEFNGHMHPTKRGDPEQQQAEHVLRHLEVLNAAYGDPEIAGCIGWCMADYNTHKDFGSGDRICHHGVLDMFREPKFAAYVYASQGDPAEGVVMQPVTYWARGERSIGGVLPLIILTNCQEIEFQYGDGPLKRLAPDRETFAHLPHAPVIIDHRNVAPDELGWWGVAWEDLTLRGLIEGAVVKELRMAADPAPARLELLPDALELDAAEKDAVRVIVRALDQAGSLLPFLNDPVCIHVDGPARLIGPDRPTLRGGSVGFWLESVGAPGVVKLVVSSERFAPVGVSFKVADG
ncbi:MAG: glycoside hydrolase family 2 TIM barrel-domain containing protein [Alphaproteobacteria bacterium]